jgi:hypothetical protein
MTEQAVTFRLVHPAGSPEEAAFPAAARELAEIPGACGFTIKRRTGPKLSHPFGIGVTFANGGDLAAHNAHPRHVRFLQALWFREVAEFREADFEAI